MKNIERLHNHVDFQGTRILHFPPHYSTSLHRQPQITTSPLFLARAGHPLVVRRLSPRLREVTDEPPHRPGTVNRDRTVTVEGDGAPRSTA